MNGDSEEYFKNINVEIDENKIIVKGILIPFISNIEISSDEIVSIELVDLNLVNRLNVVGTQDLRVWWAFDPLKIKRTKGIVVTFEKSFLSLNAVGFTSGDIDKIFDVLKELFPEKIL